jgi:GxxExxY protein
VSLWFNVFNAMHNKLSEREEYLATQIVDIAIKIHKGLGPGLLESVYEKCFVYELQERGISFQRQKEVPIIYKTLHIEDGLRLDLLVDDLVIIELKAQENYHPVWEAQLLSYLKLTNRRLGILINFHVPLMKNGIKRLIL